MYKRNIGSGDDGMTDFCGRRVKKSENELMLLAMIDEVNAFCGLIISKYEIDVLKKVESINSDIMSFIAGYIGGDKVKECIKEIEDEINKINDIEIKEFIIFDTNERSSLLNVLRTKVRIAEIYAWKLDKKDVAVYLNRLSDFIFLLAVR